MAGDTLGDSEPEENFYSKSRREALLEEDELKYEEDGFMAGYEAGIEFREEDEEDDNLEWGVDDHEGGLT